MANQDQFDRENDDKITLDVSHAGKCNHMFLNDQENSTVGTEHAFITRMTLARTEKSQILSMFRTPMRLLKKEKINLNSIKQKERQIIGLNIGGTVINEACVSTKHHSDDITEPSLRTKVLLINEGSSHKEC